MKELAPNHNEAICIEYTARQCLVKELVNYMNNTDENSLLTKEEMSNAINSIMSKYDVRKSELTSIILGIPSSLIGKTVKIHYKIDKDTVNQVFEGVVDKILYRDTSYDISEINSIIYNSNMTEEQRSLMNLTVNEETRPKIYHRLVLNTQDKGTIIVPLVKGVSIE